MDRKDMTLAGAFEAVAQNLKESGLTDSAFAKVADETSYIKAKLRVTPIQAFILATMLHHMDRTMQMMTFATFAQVSPVRILAMQKNFDCLAKKGYIVCPRDSLAAAVNNAAIEAGLKIPEDIQVLAEIGSKYSYIVRPQISSFSIDRFKVAALAVRSLTKLIKEQPLSKKTLRIRATYNKRETTI